STYRIHLITSTEHSTLMFFNNDDGELCISYQNGDADKASTFSEGFNECRVFTPTIERFAPTWKLSHV
ncbi:hypothetical protein, partial [Proteus mirabilis]|uniref:hypothetical protein n=2 Tax=Proteus mirabilis TaxID=584 RepID=UPI0019546378